MRRRLILTLTAVWVMALLAGCGGGIRDAAPSSPQGAFFAAGLEGARAEPEALQETDEKEQTAMKMNVQIGDRTFTATLEDNQAVEELVEMMEAGGVTLQLED